MKTLTIPQGYEFSHISENEIILKQVEPVYPMSIREVKDRYYNFTTAGNLTQFKNSEPTNVSTTDRARAIVALGQLVELRDAWNRVDGFVADWNDIDQKKYVIDVEYGEICKKIYFMSQCILYFGSKKTKDKFFETFKSLIETAKELL